MRKEAILDKNDSRRAIKYEVHVQAGCVFSEEEIARLQAIKNRKEWRPACERAGFVRLGILSPANKNNKKMYDELRKEFEAILLSEDSSSGISSS